MITVCTLNIAVVRDINFTYVSRLMIVSHVARKTAHTITIKSQLHIILYRSRVGMSHTRNKSHLSMPLIISLWPNKNVNCCQAL